MRSAPQVFYHGLPGDGDIHSAWLGRMNPFVQQETVRQVAFKRRNWPNLRDGYMRRGGALHYFPHMMPEGREKSVLYPPSADSILAYLDEQDIEHHSEFLNLRSSQVACLNVLYPLRLDLGLATASFRPFLSDLASVTAIEFEYTGPQGATDWLGEPLQGKRGWKRTSIDAALFWLDQQGRRHITCIEWKYTEDTFGDCHACNEADDRNEPHDCRDPDWCDLVQPESHCLLSRQDNERPRRYWEHMTEAGIDLSVFGTVRGCPFRGPFYQIMRQFQLACFLRQSGIADEADVLSLSFDGNTALLELPTQLAGMALRPDNSVIDVWNTALTAATPRMRYNTVGGFVRHVRQLPGADRRWLAYLEERYGL
jgi:hypothetical protein